MPIVDTVVWNVEPGMPNDQRLTRAPQLRQSSSNPAPIRVIDGGRVGKVIVEGGHLIGIELRHDVLQEPERAVR